jgi:hypothetical protein
MLVVHVDDEGQYYRVAQLKSQARLIGCLVSCCHKLHLTFSAFARARAEINTSILFIIIVNVFGE